MIFSCYRKCFDFKSAGKPAPDTAKSQTPLGARGETTYTETNWTRRREKSWELVANQHKKTSPEAWGTIRNGGKSAGRAWNWARSRYVGRRSIRSSLWCVEWCKNWQKHSLCILETIITRKLTEKFNITGPYVHTVQIEEKGNTLYCSKSSRKRQIALIWLLYFQDLISIQ